MLRTLRGVLIALVFLSALGAVGAGATNLIPVRAEPGFVVKHGGACHAGEPGYDATLGPQRCHAGHWDNPYEDSGPLPSKFVTIDHIPA